MGDAEGFKRLGITPAVKLVDWQIAAMQFGEEGILMAPARAIPQLLVRHGLTFKDIALWEIHEAFAAQVLANIKAASDPDYRRRRAGVEADLGDDVHRTPVAEHAAAYGHRHRESFRRPWLQRARRG